MKHTLFAIGEALIDFIPDRADCAFEQVESFSPKIGGAPANVLGAFSKLGGKTQLLTQLGDDPFGHKIFSGLSAYGIGLDHVSFTSAANTALAFVSLDSGGGRTFSFYRNPSADMLYSAENVTAEGFADCFALHFCSVSLGDFPMKDAHRRVLEYARQNGAIISFDPNLRPPLWKSSEAMVSAAKEFMPKADFIKISDNELLPLTGTDDIEAACKILLKTAKLVICTCGADGAYAFTGSTGVYVPSKKTAAKDTTGAGDAFCGSFLYSLYKNGFDRDTIGCISKDDLEKMTAASNRYCAESVQKSGAIESYPSSLEI